MDNNLQFSRSYQLNILEADHLKSINATCAIESKPTENYINSYKMPS